MAIPRSEIPLRLLSRIIFFGFVSMGRDRKREIKTLVYLAVNGLLNAERRSYLSGLLAFSYGVEPEFITRINAKYSIDAMAWLKKL